MVKADRCLLRAWTISRDVFAEWRSEMTWYRNLLSDPGLSSMVVSLLHIQAEDSLGSPSQLLPHDLDGALLRAAV